MTYNLNEIQLQVYPKFWCSNNLQIVLTTAQFKLPITEKYANLLEMHADEVNAIFATLTQDNCEVLQKHL